MASTHVGSLINALQRLQGRESDVIYEAYFEAFNRDIEEELWAGGVDAGHHPRPPRSAER